MTSVKSIIAVIVASLLIAVGFAYLLGRDTGRDLELIAEPDTPTITAPLTPEELKIANPTNVNTMNPTVVLTTNKGVVEIELFKDIMPTTASNFEKLVTEGYYNGTKFHRIIDNFMIQGGDPLSKNEADAGRWGTGGPGYAIADEFSADPRESNTRGTISMANSGPNTGGSQFFINTVDNLYLDNKHPVFGRVVSGLDVIDAMSQVETGPNDRPLEPIVIETATLKQ